MSNQCTRTKYTVEQKLRGQDLHGLSCRVPEPTPEQAKCSHEDTKSREVMDNWNSRSAAEGEG